MSFISSYFDKYKDRIVVWERTDKGRVIREHRAPRYFYVPNRLGDYDAITGEKLEKLSFKSKAEFDQAIMVHPKRFESDLSPLEKCMMDNYAGLEPPKLVYGFLDIEVDYDPSIPGGAASLVKNPYAAVNALTLYRTDTSTYVTYCVPPPGWSKVCSLDPKMVENGFIICGDEAELLNRFLDDIKNIDVLSGWNSEFFDMPYLGRRIEMLFGSLGIKRLGFDGAPPPRWTETERFTGGDKEPTLDLNSRIHLDYMRLFKKFNLEGRQSHSLAAIANDEIDVPKLHYDGSLYELYRGLWRPNLNSLKPEDEWDELYAAQVQAVIDPSEENNNLVKKLSFEKFIFYNFRDVEVIVKLDQKFKYLDLANAMVHEATVNFNAIFGSVQLIDTAIINFCHRFLKKIVFDKTHRPKQNVEGALVLSPRVGLHRWVCSVDIKSLYPSTYRTLNLSPEKIVGQLMGYEDDWKKIYRAVEQPTQEHNNATVTLRLEGCGPEDDLVISVEEMIDLLKARKFAVSAYGTILDQSSGEGLIPAVLTYWFNGRIEMQKEKKKYEKLADAALTASGNNKDDPEYLRLVKLAEYYDMLQGVRKVLLNSQYGSTLNEFCRFHDPRLGASTTGSGRQVTTHMINTIAKTLIGDDYPKIQKDVSVNRKGEVENTYTIDTPLGLGPIYSDTDSCYFSVANLVENNVEDAIACADAVCDKINESFPEFIQKAFFCQSEFSNKIKANREMVSESGIFRAKKKYIMYVRDMEGKRIDPNSSKALKTQGSDIKLSSTPEKIRWLLKEVTMMILKGEDRKKIDDFIIEFRTQLGTGDSINVLDLATVTSVKTYDEYYGKWKNIVKPGLGKVTIPAAVQAAINYNSYVETMNMTATQPIRAGDKVKMLWLKSNDHGFNNFAFGSDTEELPSWFTATFEVDMKLTEQKLVDQKLGNIFEPIGWQVPTFKTQLMNKLIEF